MDEFKQKHFQKILEYLSVKVIVKIAKTDIKLNYFLVLIYI